MSRSHKQPIIKYKGYMYSLYNKIHRRRIKRQLIELERFHWYQLNHKSLDLEFKSVKSIGRLYSVCDGIIDFRHSRDKQLVNRHSRK